MSYTRSQTFVPGAYLRQCDLCGIRYRNTHLIRGEDNFWRCKETCLEVPPLTRDRIAMQSQQRREAPPPKWGLPYDHRDAYPEEEESFNFLVTMPFRDPAWTGGMRFGASPATAPQDNSGRPVSAGATKASWSLAAVGETCRYLYSLITEDKRPAKWIALAKAKLREQADLLLANQNATGNADTNLLYGGFSQLTFTATGASTFVLVDNAAAGLALLYAYLVFGEFKYLNGARLTANIIRAFQWSGNCANFYTSSDSAGVSRLATGGHCDTLTLDSGSGNYVFSSVFRPTSLLAVEFLSLLKTTDGDKLYGGLGATAPQSFVTTGSALLSKMITDALAFWATGTYEISSGKTITGLSATTPRELFNAFPTTKPGFSSGTGNWEYSDGSASVGTTVAGASFSLALRSLFAVNGYDSQVASVWAWLMAFGSNPANIGPAGSIITDYAIQSTLNSVNPTRPPTGQGNIVQPSYDPKLALATSLQVRDPVTFAATAIEATGTTYAWQTSGDMAAIQTAHGAAAFRKAKDQATKERMRVPVDLLSAINAGAYPISESILIRGTTGLAFQTPSTLVSTTVTTATVARIANIFRYAPKAFVSSGRPDRTQSGSAPGTLQEQ